MARCRKRKESADPQPCGCTHTFAWLLVDDFCLVSDSGKDCVLLKLPEGVHAKEVTNLCSRSSQRALYFPRRSCSAKVKTWSLCSLGPFLANKFLLSATTHQSLIQQKRYPNHNCSAFMLEFVPATLDPVLPRPWHRFSKLSFRGKIRGHFWQRWKVLDRSRSLGLFPLRLQHSRSRSLDQSHRWELIGSRLSLEFIYHHDIAYKKDTTTKIQMKLREAAEQAVVWGRVQNSRWGRKN